MEKLSDILDNLRDRLRNPFIFSFILSWLVLNWRVIIGLFWYDAKEIEAEGFTSYFHLIEDNIKDEKIYAYPLLFATAYTIGLPIIKQGIDLFQTGVDMIGSWIKSTMTKRTILTGDDVLALENDYNQKTEELVTAIKRKKEVEAELQHQKATVMGLNDELAEFKRRLQSSEKFMSALYDLKRMTGIWTYRRYDEQRRMIQEERIEIHTNAVSRINADSKHHFANIKNFSFNLQTKDVFFFLVEPDRRPFVDQEGNKKVKIKVIQPLERQHFELTVNELKMVNKDMLEGYENGKIFVTYTRLDDKVE